MGMIKMLPVAMTALALISCSEKPAPVEETAASLSGGLYELSAEVTELTAADKGAPATKLKLGDKQLIKACVAADGKPAPELLAEDGDECNVQDSYVRNGRINTQLKCTRKGIDRAGNAGHRRHLQSRQLRGRDYHHDLFRSQGRRLSPDSQGQREAHRRMPAGCGRENHRLTSLSR